MEKYRLNRINIFIGAIFIFFGSLTLFFAVVSLIDRNEFQKTAVPVTARITEIEKHRIRSGKNNRTEYDVFIEYEYDGESYSGEIGYYIAGMNEGDDAAIYVDPANPSDYRSAAPVSVIMPAIFFLIFGGIGAGFLIYELRMSIYINRLISEDKYVFAEYSCEKPSGTKVNNKRYFCSVFIYDDGFGRKFTFTSQPHAPGDELYSSGDSARVYVDLENNPKRFYVSRVR